MISSRLSQFTGLVLVCAVSAGCGLTAKQRAATITYGRALDSYGQLLSDESTYIRAQVKAMRVTAMSLPGAQSNDLFKRGEYRNLGDGVAEYRIQNLVQLGGAASRLGKSLAEVADLNSATASEQIFSKTTREVIEIAGAVGQAASDVSVGAPGYNLVSYVTMENYRRRYLERALPILAPAIHAAEARLEKEFDPQNAESLLSVYSTAATQLGNVLETSVASSQSGNFSAQDRDLVANGYRLLARNRDHITYVTSRQLDLARKGAAATDALAAAFDRDYEYIAEVHDFSDAVAQVRLSFDSLR